MGATRVVIVAASSRDVSNYVDPAMENASASFFHPSCASKYFSKSHVVSLLDGLYSP